MDILEFKDQKCHPDIIHTYAPSLRADNVPIVIDNGSYQCRVGWATSPEPVLLFKNLIAKPRKERSKKETVEPAQAPQIQVGNDIANIEAVRFQLKTQFDRNVVTHFEAQEQIFDYVFTHLGIDAENSVPHPIVLTETVLNPNSSRQLMSELLFECYAIPGVSYGIDCLYSYHFNEDKPRKDALIVNLGYHTCHVVPILNRRTVFENARRLNTGGFHVITFLHRILQLKYPAHAASITLSRAEELLHGICKVAVDYREELKRWTEQDYYEKSIKKIQLPYNATLTSSALTLEQQKERKRELARRLTEINARKREERLMEDEEKLGQLLQIQEMIDAGEDREDVESACAEHQIRGAQDLHKNIANLHAKIEKTKQKIVAAAASTSTGSTVEPDWEEQQQQQLPPPLAPVLPAPPKQPKMTSRIVFENEKSMQLYVQNAKKMRQEILTKKLTRKQKRQDMAKRRTAAGQERMRIISQLARKEKGNDDFGMRDEDWDIYKTISKDGGDSDSEAENEKLLELEEIIRTHEPSELDETSNPGETHQLHVGIEMFRGPELLFKPYMMGSYEAGLSDVIGYVLSLFGADDQLRLAKNVVIMGGLASLPGLQERILTDLISVRPFRSVVNVRTVKDPSLGPWHGAKKWANSSELHEHLLTKDMYDEYGPEYFKTFVASNPYYATPKGLTIDVESLI